MIFSERANSIKAKDTSRALRLIPWLMLLRLLADTPGECLYQDNAAAVCRTVTGSDLADLVPAVSPLIMGFLSALLKKTLDRLIPLLFPYLTLAGGGCRHVSCYRRYPRWGLLLRLLALPGLTDSGRKTKSQRGLRAPPGPALRGVR